VAEVFVARVFGLRHRSLHLLARKTVESITLNETGIDILTKEYLFKGAFDG